MPPRIHSCLPLQQSSHHSASCSQAQNGRILLPLLSLKSQSRPASILSSLSDNPSAYHKQLRRGRGPSSGKGKTSGRGHKGQRQHGKVPRGFEGGQTPIEIVHGKRGFKNAFSVNLATLPLSRIQSWISQRRIDPSHPITIRELALSRCVSSIGDGVKLLASSHRHARSLDAQPPLSQPLHIVVSRASAAAIAAVEKAGGTVTTRYYTKWAIEKIVRGKMDPMVSLQSNAVMPDPAVGDTVFAGTTALIDASSGPAAGSRILALAAKGGPRPVYAHRLPDATSRKAIEYYRDPKHRGYLSHTVEEGQGPSLFFKTPSNGAVNKRIAGVGKARRTAENRIW